MATSSGVSVGGIDLLVKNIAGYDQKAKRAIALRVNLAVPQSVTYAKKNAPWTDRTGNARSGLHASASAEDNVFSLLLAHSVYYGLFLETRWNGKYAIIMPTLQWIGAKLIEEIEKDLKGIGGEL